MTQRKTSEYVLVFFITLFKVINSSYVGLKIFYSITVKSRGEMTSPA